MGGAGAGVEGRAVMSGAGAVAVAALGLGVAAGLGEGDGGLAVGIGDGASVGAGASVRTGAVLSSTTAGDAMHDASATDRSRRRMRYGYARRHTPDRLYR